MSVIESRHINGVGFIQDVAKALHRRVLEKHPDDTDLEYFQLIKGELATLSTVVLIKIDAYFESRESSKDITKE